jgi:hypothetical protein
MPPWTRTAPPLTRSVPAASRLTVMVLSWLSPRMVRLLAPGTKVVVTAGAMRSASLSRAGAGRPVRETGRDFRFSQRRDQDSAMR